MENNTGKVVSLTNPTNEDFSHPYGGQPIFVKAGETKMLPYAEGLHTAKHLARKILMSKDGGKIIGEENGKGRELYGPEDEQRVINKLLGSVITPESEPELTELQKMEARVAEMEKKFGDELRENRIQKAEEFDLKLSKSDQEYRDKADIIRILEEKGEKVARRDDKINLEKQLNKVLKAEADAAEDKKKAEAKEAKKGGKK